MRLVFYEGSQPQMLLARICEFSPLGVHTDDDRAELLVPGRRVLLIAQVSGGFSRTEGEVEKAVRSGTGWRIEVAGCGWEALDRRRYPRHPVRIPLSLRTVSEFDGEVRFGHTEATTEDLSIGGAWVRGPYPAVVGSLVEAESVLRPGVTARFLGIVVRANGNGCALEFLDYPGASRYHLHAFLSTAGRHGIVDPR